jgi:hypothetical protein
MLVNSNRRENLALASLLLQVTPSSPKAAAAGCTHTITGGPVAARERTRVRQLPMTSAENPDTDKAQTGLSLTNGGCGTDCHCFLWACLPNWDICLLQYFAALVETQQVK